METPEKRKIIEFFVHCWMVSCLSVHYTLSLSLLILSSDQETPTELCEFQRAEETERLRASGC